MTHASRLREAEIRPEALMAGQAAAAAADIAWLQSRRDLFVAVPCPACGSSAANELFFKQAFQYVSCRDCRTMYMSPRPPAPLLAEFYAASENYAYWNAHIFPASDAARREKIFRPRVERLAEIFLRNHARPSIILEVGAGFGTFCEEAARAGLADRLIAVEATPQLAATCRAKGLHVIEGPFEEITRPADMSIDAIVAFEVVEHLFSPRHFFERSAQLLTPGGVLVVTCPNGLGFDVVVLGGRSVTVDHEHLNYFNPRSIAALADACGYEPLEVLTPGKLDAELVRNQVLAGAWSLDGQPFLRQVLIDEWELKGPAFQQFLADNLLSSHLWLVARKR